MLASTFASTACSKDAPKPKADDPITIGVSLGLTKSLASTCAPLLDAITVAEGEINAGGGLLGRQVKFDVVDDRSDEKDFVTGVANDLASRDIAAVIGPAGSGQVKTVAQIFADKQILEITPTATSTDLTTIQPTNNRWLFRTTPADDFQGAAVILFATKTPRGLGDGGVDLDSGAASGDDDSGTTGTIPPSCTKLAVAYLDNSYGSSMAKVISDNFPKRGAGYAVVSQQKIPLQVASSYADVVSGMIASAPECLALIAYDTHASQFVRDFKADPGFPALDKNGFFFIGTDGVYTQGFIDSSYSDPSDPTSASTAEGVFGTNPDTQPGTTEYNRFRTLYSSYFPLKSGEDAPAFAANAFDAAVLIAFAIQKAGSATDRVAIRNAVRDVSAPPGRPISPSEIGDGLTELRAGNDIDYKGASGNVDLQSNGNTTAGFIVWQATRDPTTKKVVYKTVARFTTDELTAQIQ
jgi:branched-chain amino acid transport system substrate-binding protein